MFVFEKVSRQKLMKSIIHTTLYHGSNKKDLKKLIPFDSKQMFLGFGVYFTTTPENAKNYGCNIYEVELSIPDSEVTPLMFGEHWFTYNQFLKENDLKDTKKNFKEYVDMAHEFTDDTNSKAAYKGSQVVVYEPSIIKIIRRIAYEENYETK